MKTGTLRPEARNDVEHLAEVLPAGIELLELGVERIIAVLGDQRARRRPRACRAQGEGVGDRRAQPHAVLRLALARPRSVASGSLLDDTGWRSRRGADVRVRQSCRRGVLGVDGEAVEEPADDVVGVREVEIDARQSGDPGPRLPAAPRVEPGPRRGPVSSPALAPRAIPAAAVSRNWRRLGGWCHG